MKALQFYQDTVEEMEWDEDEQTEHYTKKTVWYCTDGISTFFGDTKTEAASHFGVPVGFED